MNADLESEKTLRRIRWLVELFIVGLLLSSATAIPLETELNWLVEMTGARALVDAPPSTGVPVWAEWLCRVQVGLQETNAK